MMQLQVFERIGRTTALIVDLVADSDARKGGIGTILVLEAMQFARERGAHEPGLKIKQDEAGNGTDLSPDPADPEQTFRVLTLYVVSDLLAER
jgi:GNAT superfamily N-acetyltransferase